MAQCWYDNNADRGRIEELYDEMHRTQVRANRCARIAVKAFYTLLDLVKKIKKAEQIDVDHYERVIQEIIDYDRGKTNG